jgi:hypothetical protein
VSDCEDSDSDVEKNGEEADLFSLAFDTFVQFKIDRKDAVNLFHLRQKLNAHLLAFLKMGVTAVNAPPDSDESKPVITALVELLREEDKKLKVPSPLNIGSKPKAAMSDCYSVPCVGESFVQVLQKPRSDVQ